MTARMAGVAQSPRLGFGLDQTEFDQAMNAMAPLRGGCRTSSMISQAQGKGAHGAADGRKMKIAVGVLERTIPTDVVPDMTAANEEVFGPVLPVLKFSSDVATIEIASRPLAVWLAAPSPATSAARLRAEQAFVSECNAGGV